MEQFFCTLLIFQLQGTVTNFIHDKVIIAFCWRRTVNAERILLLCNQSRVVSQQIPVSSSYCLFHFLHSVAHTTLYTMVDARCICDDQGWSIVAFCFTHCLKRLCRVCTHCDLSYINVTVSHNYFSQILFLDPLSACRKLCYRTCRSRLGCLTACIGIYFRIEHQYIYIFTRCQHVIKAAVTDIVSPSVSTKYPHGRFRQHIFVIYYVFCIL